MRKKVSKIAYLLAGVIFFGISNAAFSFEIVSASEEIPVLKTKSDKAASKENNQTYYESNELGVYDFENINLEKDREEIHIDNPFEKRKEARKQKKLNLQNAAQEEEKDKGLKIECSEMEYFEDRNELEARGDVLITSDSGIRANADKAVYNREDNTIKLIGNVVLKHSNTNITGDYMFVDMNEENALMNDPVTKLNTLVVTAKEGFAYSDRIENINGIAGFDQRVEMEFGSAGFSKFGRALNDKRLVDFELKKQRSKPYMFKCKNIVIRPERDHDSMILKDVDVYYKNRKIVNVPSIEFFSDKEMTYSEANFPLEFGSLKGLGMYLGLGYTFKLPKTYTFRATPIVTYGEDDYGAGVIAQLKSRKTRFESAWSSSTNNLIFDGEVKFTEKFKLDLGRHVYKSEWFNGGTRAGYLAELSYHDAYMAEELGDSIFKHRFSAGYVADYKRKHQEKNMKDGYRYRYQAELTKNIKTFGNEEQDLYITFSAVAQTSASVYSETGDTAAFFRIGPSITSRVKRSNLNITTTLGGVHGLSPYRFDEYRYGRQTISFDESLILSRFLSVGYRGVISPKKDNSQGDILTENRFYAVAGPEDFKLAFSYDAMRQNMHFDFLFLLGSDNLNMQYEKLTIKNPEKIGKPQRKVSDKDINRVKIPENL